MALSGVLKAAAELALLFTLIAGPAALALAKLYELNVTHWQLVEVEVEVVDEKGLPAGPVYVAAFELADGGPKLLAEGRAGASGTFRFAAKVARRLVAELEDGTRIYAPLNLWVVASREDGLIGTVTQPIDISRVKHPLDTVRLKVMGRKVVQAAASEALLTEQTCSIQFPYQEESWAYTSVLMFGIWDNMQVTFIYPIGSIFYIETKERYIAIPSCYVSDWWRSGGTYVTLDQGISGSESIRTVHTVQFRFKYILVRYYPLNQNNVIIEKVYAADTSLDPDAARKILNSWNGQLPSWSYAVWIDQGYCRTIYVTGTTFAFSFSVGVSFPRVGVGVSLGVSKAPEPRGTMTLCAGTWQQGYQVKTVSQDGTFVISYSNWAVPP